MNWLTVTSSQPDSFCWFENLDSNAHAGIRLILRVRYGFSFFIFLSSDFKTIQIDELSCCFAFKKSANKFLKYLKTKKKKSFFRRRRFWCQGHLFSKTLILWKYRCDLWPVASWQVLSISGEGRRRRQLSYNGSATVHNFSFIFGFKVGYSANQPASLLTNTWLWFFFFFFSFAYKIKLCFLL